MDKIKRSNFGFNLIGNEIELWIITAYYPDNIKWEDDLKTRKVFYTEKVA